MATPVIYGPDYSTYVRTVRLTFEEKPAEYRLEPIHILGGEAQKENYLRRHPFGKVPAFEHDGLSLYETGAIARYVDRAFPGRQLQPSDLRAKAHMDQVIGILDSYAYGSMIGKVVWQRMIVPMTGGQGEDAVVQEAKPMVSRCLSELERIMGDGQFLVGPELSLADLFLAPVFAYLTMVPDAEELLQPHARLRRWWEMMSQRDSMQKTQPKLG
jgi:glutathione S-transferase